MGVKVSVVIPAYNEEDVIRGCIESVLKNNFKNMEIIVVDDGSKDRTVEEVRSIKDRRVKVVQLKKNSGAARARNTGIDNAKGEFIILTDADCVVSENWVSEHLKSLKKYDFVLGSSTPINVGEGLISKAFYCMSMEKWEKKRGKIVSATTANGSFRREVFEKVRFDESFRTAAYEDEDFTIRVEEVGFKKGYNPKAGVKHVFHESLCGQLRRSFLASDAFNVFARKHRTWKRTGLQVISVAVTIIFPLLIPFSFLLALKDFEHMCRASRKLGMGYLPFLLVFETARNAVHSFGTTYHLIKPRWRG